LERFRIATEKMKLLLEQIGYMLQHNSGVLRLNNNYVCTALHWVESGSQYHTISDMHGVNKATVRRAIIAIYVTSS
jgi:hypothetical protein